MNMTQNQFIKARKMQLMIQLWHLTPAIKSASLKVKNVHLKLQRLQIWQLLLLFWVTP